MIKLILQQFSGAVRFLYFLTISTSQQRHKHMDCKQNDQYRSNDSSISFHQFIARLFEGENGHFSLFSSLLVHFFLSISINYGDDEYKRFRITNSHKIFRLTCASVSVLSIWYFNKSFNETDVWTISASMGIKGSIIICWRSRKFHENKRRKIIDSISLS